MKYLFVYLIFLLPSALLCQQSDSVRITLERVCTGFGNFTEYRVTIDGEGLVVYEEKAHIRKASNDSSYFVEKTRFHISRSSVDSLVHEFLRINYFALEDEYSVKTIRSAPGEWPPTVSMQIVTDQHTAITSLRLGSQFKRVLHYYGAPHELTLIETRIDSLARLPKFDEQPVD